MCFGLSSLLQNRLLLDDNGKPCKKWGHFAGTYDSKSGDVFTYMDGEETHNAKGTGKLSDNWNVSAGIGHHKQGRWFDGLMDEFYECGYFFDALQATANSCEVEVYPIICSKFRNITFRNQPPSGRLLSTVSGYSAEWVQSRSITTR